MNDLFGEVPTPPTPHKKGNPMVTTYGRGPEEYRCKHCQHFIDRRDKYFKCSYRGNTNSPATDHRANWPTCSKFEGDGSKT
ncbi:hypothetical protein BWI93_05275 [Siphonobacter sp. BAB-5385]|uniref:hypothetical protein n=1 Tax=Siphonobacter sp. BAB-5385 TaxID=1864822 RepID=UPI000B9E8804|nr:hypothetical protein [Siphonobacter sp. BAB-5385]OZI09158.1 hypothetical protein BWI93_05275 [Siphonobacter sp. BAB-5385]